MNGLTNILEGIAGAFLIATGAVTPFWRSRRTSWGATNDEIKRPSPGDDMIPKPKWQYTNAITVRKGVESVWPWLVQIGQGRGGFYSYQALENLVGCNIHNAEEIVPEFQHLAAGDNVMLHPRVPFPVVLVDPGKSIVLHYDSRKGIESTSKKRPAYFESTWVFLLDRAGDDVTRFMARFRIDYSPGIGNRISLGYFGEPIYTAMQRKMLRGLKRRAEMTA